MAEPLFNPAPTRFIINPGHHGGGKTFLPDDVVRHYAPDALVLINRSYTVPAGCNACACNKSIKEDITNISINVGVRQSPATASFTIVAPRTSNTNYYDRGYFRLQPMQEVNIFFKARFPISQDENQKGPVGNLDDINSPFPYYHVFWGVITSVKKSESARGNEIINVECNDMLRFWEMTEVLVNPSFSDSDKTGIKETIKNTIFHGLKAPEIMLTLANSIQPQLYQPQSLIASITPTQKAREEVLNSGLRNYWEERFKTLSSSLRIFGFSGTKVSEGDIYKTEIRNHSEYFGRESVFFKINNTLSADKFASVGSNQDKALIENVLPFFDTNLSSPELFQTDTDSMLSIAKQVAESSGWEFYQDVTGEIIFKPPFFNMDTSGYTPYEIEPKEIISEDHVEEEGDIYTVVDVTASLHHLVDGAEFKRFGRFVNYPMIQKYGVRLKTVSMPYLTSDTAAYLFAQNIMSRHNAETLHTATITIVGRPELRPGYPVYLPHKDMFYYITALSHNFSWGDDFSTSLTLRAGRRRLYSLPISGSEPYEKGMNLDKDPLKNMYMALIDGKKQKTENAKAKKDGAEQIPLVPSDELPKEYKTSLITDKGTWVYMTGSELLSKKQDYTPLSVSGVARNVLEVIPVSDEHGFELVGTFPYGRYLALDNTGQVTYSDLVSERDSKNKLNNSSTISVRGGTITNQSIGKVFVESLDKGNANDGSIQTINSGIKESIPLYPAATGSITSSDLLSNEEKIIQLTTMRPDDSQDACYCNCHYTQPEIKSSKEKGDTKSKAELTLKDKNQFVAIPFRAGVTEQDQPE